jgi:hypothetical protein
LLFFTSWRPPAALATLALGYLGAYILLGGIAPNHQALIGRAMKSHLLDTALTFLTH